VIITTLQDTKLIYNNQLFSYITAINKWNLKLKTQSHLPDITRKALSFSPLTMMLAVGFFVDYQVEKDPLYS